MKKIVFCILVTATIFTINSTLTYAEEHPEFATPTTAVNCNKITSKNPHPLGCKIKFTLNEEHPDY